MGMVVPNEDNTPYAKKLQRQIDTWRMRAQMARQIGVQGNSRGSTLEQEALKRANDYQKELNRVLDLNDT
jgi:hypothetical protein